MSSRLFRFDKSARRKKSVKDMSQIPGPKPLPVVGNVLDVDINDGLNSIIKLGQQYGPVYSLDFGAGREIFTCSHSILDELCDETRFHKLVSGGVERLRQLAGDGLFTAQHGAHDWEVAHRILMPVFGPLKIRGMFDQMKDVAEQMCLRWARADDSQPLDVTGDFTRLTLDTIALCAMDYRFNSFYLNDKTHPFVESMMLSLHEADKQSMLPDFVNALRLGPMAQFKKHNGRMMEICRELIRHRRQHPVDSPDLLNAMMNGRDPKTGEQMSEQSIINNLITFLVAGHETTSGLLSFVVYYLLSNPETMRKARDEVDAVVGDEPLTISHLQKLPYLDGCLREALRLMPTAPGFTVTPIKDELLGGKYEVKKGEPVFALLHMVHRDPEVWGDDAEEFKPERMMGENFDKIPKNAWKPFGNGLRGCIGRAFAWQEAQMILALLLQNFELSKEKPDYELKIVQMLTIKPVDFNVRAKLRDGKTSSTLFKTLDDKKKMRSAANNGVKRPVAANGPPMTILFGSNTGTCEALAQRLAADALDKGFAPREVAAIDAAKGRLPRGEPVVLVAASYDGQPSENSAEFVKWVSSLKAGELEGVAFAVFGCGHKDWVATYMKIPRVLNKALEDAGAERLAELGTGDSATQDLFSELESWMDDHLWPSLTTKYQVTPDSNGAKADIDLQITFEKPPRLAMRRGFVPAIVTKARVLSSPGVAQKRHLELEFPSDIKYEPGDHLQVLPSNGTSQVQRVLSRFHIGADTLLTLSSARSTGLPTDTPITAADLLGGYVELNQTASPNRIQQLTDFTRDKPTKLALQQLATTSYDSDVRDKSVSILDLLEQFPSLELPLHTFLSMLSQMRPRTYSLSSAPAWNPGHGTLTYSVVGGAGAASGLHHTQQQPAGPTRRGFAGVASNYLAFLEPGHVVYVSLRQTKPEFRGPLADVAGSSAPLVMVATGSGLAPFRGALQQRALHARKSGGVASMAPAMLFYGSRGAGLDDMYREELDGYERAGIVTVHRAFSREAQGGPRHVQDAIRGRRDEVAQAWRQGGRVLVCSGKKVADSVFEVLGPILFEEDRRAGRTIASSLSTWMDGLPRGRYVAEVFN